jgi:hypothetical protein
MLEGNCPQFVLRDVLNSEKSKLDGARANIRNCGKPVDGCCLNTALLGVSLETW